MNDRKKPGRPTTGTVTKTRSGLLQGIITLVDGTRKRLPPFPKGTSAAKAKEVTQAAAERFAAEGVTKAQLEGREPPRSSGDGWWTAYLAHREAKGLSPVMHVYRPHLKPMLGDKHPRDWTKADAERLVAALDAKIISTGDDRISWKTAANVWSLFTTACKVASSVKAPAGLKVRDSNPSVGVEGPERGEELEKQWLYPVELSKLLACTTVPLRWRQLYAILTYSYVRPSELAVLEWTDVDFDIGTLHVSKAWDEKRGRVKTPKTRAGVRHVPIEPTLLPLLKALHAAAGGQGKVIPNMPPMEDWAEKLRRHLRRAKVDRAALFANTATHKQVRLYDLRATGITWRCLRKDYGPEIQQAAGHEKYDTTDGYIRTARVFIGRVGDPFPPLPPSIAPVGFDREFRSIQSQVIENVVTPARIELALPA